MSRACCCIKYSLGKLIGDNALNSSSEYGVPYNANKSIDNHLNTFFNTKHKERAQEWLQIDMGIEVMVKKILVLGEWSITHSYVNST